MLSFIVICALITFNKTFGYITYFEPKYPLKGKIPALGTPWPLPQRWDPGSLILSLDRDTFEMKSSLSKTCDVMKHALSRYRKLIFANKIVKLDPNSKELTSLQVNVKVKNCGTPKMDDDEYYRIEVGTDDSIAFISANTVWGALRGLETFSQLIYINQGYLNINTTIIEDWPRYKHRGIMIDTSKHFIPVHLILLNLDIMAYNKFNVLHWRLSDDQSFPLEISLFPNFTEFAAYSMHLVYSREDVKKVVDEARLRGIRIIPELNSPAHTQSIGRALPEILTACYSDNEVFKAVIGKYAKAEIIDPTKSYSYEVMNELFSYLRNLFLDDYIHLGMDGVSYDCWKSNPNINRYIDKKNISYPQLESHYIKKTFDNIKFIGFKNIIYQDPIDKEGVHVDSETIVQVWKDKSINENFKSWKEYMQDIANKNYQMILSSCWHIERACNTSAWEEFYSCDPQSFTESEKSRLVIGGETYLTTEYIDETNFIQTLWPIASAVGEKLWSKANDTQNIDNARFRLDQLRCTLVNRNIAAPPIGNGYCELHESYAAPQFHSTIIITVIFFLIFIIFC